MFTLSQAIKDWREELVRAKINDSAIDELESHLQEHIGLLINECGMSEREAFATARDQIGSPRELAPEFKKVGQLLLADQIALSLCSLLVVVFMIWCGHLITSLINGAIAVEDPLLLIQVMTNDAGMLGMLLLALLGAYSATRRFFSTYAESTWITILSSLLRWVVLAGLASTSLGVIVWAVQNREINFTGSHVEWTGIFLFLWYFTGFAWLTLNSCHARWIPTLAISGGISFIAQWLAAVQIPHTSTPILIATSIQIGLLFSSRYLFPSQEPYRPAAA